MKKKTDSSKSLRQSTEIRLQNTPSIRPCLKATIERFFSQVNLPRPLIIEASSRSKKTMSLGDFNLLLKKVRSGRRRVKKIGTETEADSNA
jgi:hypothetical protein